ncbi:hypothetical protein D9M71_392890 [compost metagenome]
MDQGHDRTDRKLPLKAERQVDQDAAQRHQHAEAALVAQLFTHLRADELDALDRRRVLAADLLQGLGHLVTQLRVFARHAHQQIGGCTEVLHDGFLITRGRQLLTHLGDIGRTLVGQLDERTAGEVQPPVHALGGDAEQGQRSKEQCDAEREVANAHEVDCT